MTLTLNSALFTTTLKLCAFLLISCATTIATSAEVYKWVDSNGNTHYTDKKPNHTESTSIQIKTSTASQRTSAQNQAKAIDEKTAKEMQVRQEIAQEEARKIEIEEKCKAIRENLRVIAETSRITVVEEGVTRFLSPEEINEKKANFQKQIEDYCQ